MSQNICNICGANYEYRGGRWICPACGAYKSEELSNEEVTLLYNAAQKLRVQEFDDAEELYLDIIQKYSKQHEAYWGCVCSRYGIKVEEDIDGRRIPTCCFPSIESFLEDKDFKKAIELAPRDMKEWYQEQAGYIERVRTTWIDMAKNEQPCDIFISYKDSDIANGIERTIDSINALELYNHLARQGYNVFYSRESLRDKVGEKYEPYIFNALKTAKLMILYGSSVEYINSTWVKNEWHRYLKQIARGEKKEGSLLVVCDGFSPNELPKILASKQCLDGMSKTLYVDIDNYLKQLFAKKEKRETVAPKKQAKISPLHEHIYIDEIVPSTCIAKGYTVHKCNCGYEYKDSYTKLAEHTYEYKRTLEPTCITEGYKEYSCLVCGDTKKESIPKKGHTFGKWIEKSKATCAGKGVNVRQCEECGHTEEENTPALGHEWDKPEYRSKGDGTGKYYITCQRCGTEKPADKCFKDGAYQHNWTFLKQERLNGDNYDYTYRCTVCGEKEKIGLPILKVGDTIEFGSYYSTKMKWKVLDIKNEKALLLSEYTIDKKFDDEGGYSFSGLKDWATSQRRQWLNAAFFNGSFAIDEKNRIIETTISNHCKEIIDTTDKYGQKSEKINYVQQEATNDKIFLLSVKECKTFNLLKDENWSVISKEGLKSTYRGRDWYTRTVGAHRYKDDKLSVWGFVTNSGDSSSVATLRPAMWIDLSCADDVAKRVRAEKIAEEKRLQEEKIAEEIKQKETEKKQAAIQFETARKTIKTDIILFLLFIPLAMLFTVVFFASCGEKDLFSSLGNLICLALAGLCWFGVVGFFQEWSKENKKLEEAKRKIEQYKDIDNSK